MSLWNFLKLTGAGSAESTLSHWLVNAARLGNRRSRIVWGKGFCALDSSAENRAGSRARHKRPDIVLEDWNKEIHGGWAVEGIAFGKGPVRKSEMPACQCDVCGDTAWVLNSKAPSGTDAATGKPTGRRFKLEQNFINVWIGGDGYDYQGPIRPIGFTPQLTPEKFKVMESRGAFNQLDEGWKCYCHAGGRSGSEAKQPSELGTRVSGRKAVRQLAKLRYSPVIPKMFPAFQSSQLRVGRSVRHGFTLVELLVVVAIVAVLAAFLFSVLQKGAASSKFVKCAANLRALGAGCLAFAADNNGGLPHQDQGPVGTKLLWGEVALGGERISKQEQARRLCCPSMAEPALNIWTGFSPGYGYNPNLGTYEYYFTKQICDGNSYPNVRLASIQRPSQVILATDTGQEQNKGAQEMFSMWSPYGCMRVSNGVWQLVPARVNPASAEQPVDPTYFQDGDPAGFEHRLPAWPFQKAGGSVRVSRHGGKVNCLFVDGHVEARRPEEILEKNIYWSY